MTDHIKIVQHVKSERRQELNHHCTSVVNDGSNVGHGGFGYVLGSGVLVYLHLEHDHIGGQTTDG
jgi:hypothetical protein